MLITKLFIDNLFSFEDFEVDFTFTRKPSFNPVEHEYLELAPNFKVKRVCILSGANATGKTALGNVLLAVLNLVFSPSGIHLQQAFNRLKIRDKTRVATLKIEFVLPSSLDYFEIEYVFKDARHDVLEGVQEQGILIESAVCKHIQISKSDSNGLARKTLLSSKPIYEQTSNTQDADSLIKKLSVRVLDTVKKLNIGWNVQLYDVSDDSDSHKRHFMRSKLNIERVKKLFMAFDATVTDLVPVFTVDAQTGNKEERTSPAGYQLRFNNGDVLLLDVDLKAQNVTRISKGTSEVLVLAPFIERVIELGKAGKSTVSFLDERLSHVHSNLESAIVNVMIQHLGKQSQLFYTTHNTDLLEMNVPTHSHLFLRRKANGMVEAVQPERTFKKNDRKLLNYVKNDVFGTLPDSSLIDELAYED